MRLRRREEERKSLLGGLFSRRRDASLTVSPEPALPQPQPIPDVPALRTVECRLALAGVLPAAVPIPPSSPAQTVDDISVGSSDVPLARFDPSSLTTYVELLPGADDPSHGVTLTCRIRRHRVTTPVDPDEAARYAVVAAEFRDRIASAELEDSIGERVASILRFVQSTVTLKEGDASLPPDPAAALEKGQGGPADLCACFVQLCRAAGIPARLVVGVALPPGRTPSTMQVRDLRCRAQFLNEESFWVTVDLAAGGRSKPNPESAFREVDPDFLALAVDPDRTTPTSVFLFPGQRPPAVVRRQIAFRDLD